MSPMTKLGMAERKLAVLEAEFGIWGRGLG
jgi:hypothetical protein